MHTYPIKLLILGMLICGIFVFKKDGKVVVNEAHNVLLSVGTSLADENIIIYKGFTKAELVSKIDNVLNSTLKGYGKVIVDKSMENEVDPVIAASIILVETGCKWSCSSLVKSCNNVGGMKGSGCGVYSKFASLDAGLEKFIQNLSNNYFKKGLTTPEEINRKYATNKEWYKSVYYYIDLIEAS